MQQVLAIVGGFHSAVAARVASLSAILEVPQVRDSVRCAVQKQLKLPSQYSGDRNKDYGQRVFESKVILLRLAMVQKAMMFCLEATCTWRYVVSEFLSPPSLFWFLYHLRWHLQKPQGSARPSETLSLMGERVSEGRLEQHCMQSDNWEQRIPRAEVKKDGLW